MLTAENYAANRRTAAANVRAELSLTDLPPSDWSYSQRIEYNKRLAAVIAANPASFSEQDNRTAEIVTGKTYSPLSENSALDDLETFADAIGDEAASINEAVNPFSSGNRKLILFVVVGAALVYFLGPRLMASRK